VDVLPRHQEGLSVSRIVALLAPAGAPPPREPCAAALGAVARPGWRTQLLTRGAAALGWKGAGQANVAEQGERIAVVDGRFYNRADLPAAASDAGRLIALYEKHGIEAALSRINGDFGFALYDAGTATLLVGRDRFGLKPLYWARAQGGIAIASQPRALIALPGVGDSPDREFVARFAACHYRVFDNPVARSAYADIAQVPAASGLAFDVNGGARPFTWWRLAEQPEFAGSEDALAEEYRSLLMDAVRIRQEGAQAPAFTLSGGMDSSSVLSCAAAAAGAPRIAYSSVYADRTFDESDDIAPMLAGKVADWRRVPLGNDVDVPALVRRMVDAHDEPVATATWLSHFVLAEKAAAEGVGTLFGGMGGDELNAGEYEYFFFHFADLQAAGRQKELEHEIACWAQHHDHPIWRKNRDTALAGIARLSDPSRPGGVRTDRERLERYWPALRRDWFDLSGYEPVLDHPFASALKNRTYQDIFRETAPCCLRAEDRHATHFGLERVDPFFDHRLVEFMFRVPGHMKIRDGVTKRLLRTAMAGILPEETRTRIKKTGWNAPAHVWFMGRGLEAVRDRVASRGFRDRGVYDVAAVERIIDAHAAAVMDPQPRENHMMFLWQLVNLDTWMAGL
jgi:asparagine synthase (glutamine-hydrolysing)